MATLKTSIRAELLAEAQQIEDATRAFLPRSPGRVSLSYRPGGVAIVTTMANVEHMSAQLRATGITLQPLREVTEVEPGIFAVSDSDFSTTDPVLAASVAAELDRVDPLRGVA